MSDLLVIKKYTMNIDIKNTIGFLIIFAANTAFAILVNYLFSSETRTTKLQRIHSKYMYRGERSWSALM